MALPDQFAGATLQRLEPDARQHDFAAQRAPLIAVFLGPRDRFRSVPGEVLVTENFERDIDPALFAIKQLVACDFRRQRERGGRGSV
jgi:hypothetical protein